MSLDKDKNGIKTVYKLLIIVSRKKLEKKMKQWRSTYAGSVFRSEQVICVNQPLNEDEIHHKRIITIDEVIKLKSIFEGFVWYCIIV